MGLRKGLFLLLSAAALGACLPRPEEPIEYLQRPDAIIVQMVDVGGLPQPEAADRLTVPAFTLYGDGTLIFMRPEDRAQFIRPDDTGKFPLLQTQLPEEAIRELLGFIVDEGFLEFAYEQPRPGSRYDFPTTYLYVHTKLEANAVSAYALGVELPEDAGKEWGQFRRLQKIKQRLDELAPAVLGGPVLDSYEPEEIVLIVEPLDSADLLPEPPMWPVPDVDLSSLAPLGSGVVTQRLPAAEASRLAATISSGTYVYHQGDRSFFVGYRPVLPYEEHFPEFDAP